MSRQDTKRQFYFAKTYTTTEIRAGNTDVAEVYFYSRDEFNKNFKRMLNDVQYPDAADFSTMTLETFVRYWKAVETDPAQRGIFLLHRRLGAGLS